MPNIVSVGADLFLLYTRSMVLAKAGASVQNVAPEQALLLLDSRPSDLFIVCHSTHDAARLCLAARTRVPAMKILLLESPVSSHCVSADVQRFQLEDGPAALLRTVNRLLAEFEPEQPAATTRLVPVVRSVSRNSHKLDSLKHLDRSRSAGLHISRKHNQNLIHMPSASLRCNTPSIIPFNANSSSGSYRYPSSRKNA